MQALYKDRENNGRIPEGRKIVSEFTIKKISWILEQSSPTRLEKKLH